MSEPQGSAKPGLCAAFSYTTRNTKRIQFSIGTAAGSFPIAEIVFPPLRILQPNCVIRGAKLQKEILKNR